MTRSLPVALLALLGAAGTAAGQVPAFHNFPAGVTDPEGKVGYVHAVKGGTEAIDLATGKVRWSYKEEARPLALVGGLLVCQAPEAGKANAIRVLILDADSGKLVRKSDAVAFPEWVSVGVTHGRSFTASAELDGELIVRVDWEARAWYAGGARPTPEIEEAARKHAAGSVVIHVGTGKAELAQGRKKLGPPKAPAALGQPAQIWTGSAWLEAPLVIDRTAVAVFKKQAVGGQKLELASWDVGEKTAREPKTLLVGKELWPQLGLDGKHLFVHQAIPQEQLKPAERVWTVFALPSGKEVAKIPYNASGNGGIALIGPRAYYAFGEQRFGGKSTRAVRAVDVASGKTLWEHAVWAPPVLLPLP